MLFSPVFLASSPATGGSWSVLQGEEEVVEHSVVLGEDDGGHLKLALKSVYLLLEVVKCLCHLLPLFDLLEKLYQTVQGKFHITYYMCCFPEISLLFEHHFTNKTYVYI